MSSNYDIDVSDHSPSDILPDEIRHPDDDEAAELGIDFDPENAELAEETLKSLFKINKHARKYADKAHQHYRRRKHHSAKHNSYRKKALYRLKGKVLSMIAREADTIEGHKINGEKYTCLYFGDWSFHCKPQELNLSAADYDIEEYEQLNDFEKDADTGDMTRSLKDSLLHLQEEFGLSANDFLPRKKVGRYFCGWSYL